MKATLLHKRWAILLLSAGVFAQTPQPPQPNSVPIAKKALDLLLAQKFTELRPMFNDELARRVSDDTLQKQLIPQLNAVGKPEKIGTPEVRHTPGLTAVIFPVKFAAGDFLFSISVDENGKLGGFGVKAAPPPETPQPQITRWTSPPYVRPEAFRIREVTIGEGQWKLPGTLLVPLGKGPFPAVVLVHGSGAQDRDGSVSLNKPLRDIAEGLASRGIIVLRYDKRTKIYPAQVAALKNFTIAQEITEDALQALAFLRTQPLVDARHISVVAHSLGAYDGPRIAAADGRLAGLALLAAGVRPLENLVVEQAQYLHAPPQQIAQLRDEAAKVKAIEAGQNNVPGALGAPASYWLDLKGYNPAATARSLKCPLFILQGNRDFQVTQQDFAAWRSALSGKSNVTFQEYPSLNHLFMAGEGKSSPAEYQKSGHVSEDVVLDLAIWVNSLT